MKNSICTDFVFFQDEMDPGPGGLRGASENGAPETSDHIGRYPFEACCTSGLMLLPKFEQYILDGHAVELFSWKG